MEQQSYNYTFDIGKDFYTTILKDCDSVFTSEESIDKFLEILFKSGANLNTVPDFEDVFTEDIRAKMVGLDDNGKLAYIASIAQILLYNIGQEFLKRNAVIEEEENNA